MKSTDGEVAPEEHLPVRLHQDRIHRADEVYLEGVERPVRVDPGEVLARHVVLDGEYASEEHLPVRLHRNRIDATGAPHVRGEGGVERAVRIEPGEAGALHPVDTGEFASDEHLPVRLHRDRMHYVVQL